MRHTIIPYNPQLKERARELRRKMTLAEVLLWKQLKGKQLCGYDFDRQRPVGRGIVDFYCKELNLAVDVDGSVHGFTREKDERRQRELEALGLILLRFWNYEVKTDIAAVVRRIEEWIRLEEKRRGLPRREAGTKPTPNPSKGGELVDDVTRQAGVSNTATRASEFPSWEGSGVGFRNTLRDAILMKCKQ